MIVCFSSATFSCLGAGMGGGVELAETFNQSQVLLGEPNWGGGRKKQLIVSGHLMYSMVTMINNTVSYT